MLFEPFYLNISYISEKHQQRYGLQKLSKGNVFSLKLSKTIRFETSIFHNCTAAYCLAFDSHFTHDKENHRLLKLFGGERYHSNESG